MKLKSAGHKYDKQACSRKVCDLIDLISGKFAFISITLLDKLGTSDVKHVK